MRIRSVNPDLCRSEKMAGLPAALERTFIRLWMHCDDEGRCLDNLRLIRAAIYPLVDQMSLERLDKELQALEGANLIVRYVVHGKGYLAVRSWGEYQHPQRKTRSKYPKPPEPVADNSRTDQGALAELSHEEELHVRDMSPEDDLPVADTSRQERETGEGDRRQEIAPIESARSWRKPDALWDALMDVCGVETAEITDDARGAYNRALKQIRQRGGQPGEIRRRALIYRESFPGRLTPSALARHWAECSGRVVADRSDPAVW